MNLQYYTYEQCMEDCEALGGYPYECRPKCRRYHPRQAYTFTGFYGMSPQPWQQYGPGPQPWQQYGPGPQPWQQYGSSPQSWLRYCPQNCDKEECYRVCREWGYWTPDECRYRCNCCEFS